MTMMSNLPSQNFAMESFLVQNIDTVLIMIQITMHLLVDYIAECHYVDGSQLDASSFGEFDDDSGIWKPKQYTGINTEQVVII